MIDAGESEENIATVIKAQKGLAVSHDQPQPSSLDTATQLLSGAGPATGGMAALGLRGLKAIRDNPAAAGGAIGAGAMGLATGGLGVLPAMALTGLGGAGGAGAGLAASQIANRDTQPAPTEGGNIKEMATQGALNAAGEGIGRGLTSGLQTIGRGLYGAALRPAASATQKYGDLVGAGLAERAPIGSSATVQGSMGASRNAADQLVAEAQAAGKTVPTSAVSFQKPLDAAMRREALGLGTTDTNEVLAREAAWNAAHPSGQIQPVAAHALKREADVVGNTAQNALQRGTALSDMTASLNDATRGGLKHGLEQIAPGLEEQNARTRTLQGLSRALRAAESRPNGTINLAEPESILRALIGSKGESMGGIALHEASKVPYANAARLALLAGMIGQEQ